MLFFSWGLLRCRACVDHEGGWGGGVGEGDLGGES